MNKTVIVVIVILVVLVGGYYFTTVDVTEPGEFIACTQEAKICLDGSAVGRTGPDCEFAKCPGEVDVTEPGEFIACTQEAKICLDGSGVGRTGPDCEFAKCPGELEGFFPGTQEECLIKDGIWTDPGNDLERNFRCFLPTVDGGRLCFDSVMCGGSCLVADGDAEIGERITGTCSKYYDVNGNHQHSCWQTVSNGIADEAVCF